MQWQELRSHLRHLSETELQRVQEGFLMGQRAHAGQTRKSGEPYFSHPIAIAHLLADMGGDADTIIAALLHDTVEDTDVTLPQIRMAFGDTVANLIDGLTKLCKEDVAERPSLDEQIETLRKMFTLMQQDIRIMVIKLVDRLHNMQTISFLSPERQRGMAQETLDVYVKIADRLSMQDLRDELESLSLAVLNADEHNSLLELRKENDHRGRKAIASISKALHEQTQAPQLQLLHEYKTWTELRKQQERGDSAATGVPDIIVVFLCPTIDACYGTLGRLHQTWPRETLSFQDYINSPLLNGYQALHTTVILDNGLRVRCKIRTADMHTYARKGIASVCFDKRAKGLLDYLPWANRITAVSQDTAERSAEFWKSLQSDILGETITIHAPTGEAVQVPKTSTALDGAFYVFGDIALRTQDVLVNGEAVPFFTLLKHADSISLKTAPEMRAVHGWLQWVNTGLATAGIRSALSTFGKKELLQTGQQMLSHTLHDRSLGLLEELQEESVNEKIRRLGYGTMQEVHIAIAEGHLNPSVVADALFAKVEHNGEKTQKWVIHFAIEQQDEEVMQRIEHIREYYDGAIVDEHTHNDAATHQSQITWRCQLSAANQRMLLMALRDTGATDVKVSFLHTHVKSLIGTIFLIVIWGLDPVVSHILVQNVLSPLELTYLRFVTVFLASTIVYGFHSAISTAKLKPLQPLQPSLLFAGLSYFTTAILTYEALTMMPASLYILFVLAMQLCTLIVKQIMHRSKQTLAVMPLGLILVAIICFLTVHPSSWLAVLLATGSAGSFALYSAFSDLYQRNMIHTRYPAYLFWLSIVGLLCCFAILPFQPLIPLEPQKLLLGMGFSLVFVFIPYVLFFEATRRLGRDVLDRLLPLTCLATFAAEFLFAPTFSVLFILGIICTVFSLQYITMKR